MIAITNTTPGQDSPATYTVQINRGPVVATFEHYRRDGLAVCLSRAAESVAMADAERIIQELKRIDEARGVK